MLTFADATYVPVAYASRQTRGRWLIPKARIAIKFSENLFQMPEFQIFGSFYEKCRLVGKAIFVAPCNYEHIETGQRVGIARQTEDRGQQGKMKAGTFHVVSDQGNILVFAGSDHASYF
jgi:hypothetical protein